MFSRNSAAIVKILNVEQPGKFEVSDAATLLAQLELGSQQDKILDYWFGADREHPKEDYGLWYDGAQATDDHIRQNFLVALEAAQTGKLRHWVHESKYACLALIVLLDQFALNAYRDVAKGFDVSALAIPLAYEAIEKGYDKALPTVMANFR